MCAVEFVGGCHGTIRRRGPVARSAGLVPADRQTDLPAAGPARVPPDRRSHDVGRTFLFPTLLLTTTGHRSGTACTTPLFFVRDGESIIVAGSNFGLPAHPVWSENLLRNREATVQIGQGSRRYTARPASDSEAARAWPRLVEFWPAYDRYRERAGRDIRIFVLTPA